MLFSKPILIACSLLLIATSVFAQPDLSDGRRGSTPYDPYRAPVDAVLRSLNGPEPSFQRVQVLMRQGYAIRYVFEDPYLAQSPRETEARRKGDCKAKSLWLAHKMNDANVRYVIGKASRSSKISHAWLMWKSQGRWWILDPTNTPHPIPASSVGPNDYIVYYSYDRTGSFTHNTVRPSKSVAGRK